MKRRAPYRFCLYVAGNAVNSTLARANLDAICIRYLPGRHEIEVVDVFRDPRRALADGIFMTPTLVRVAPGPLVRIVGTLGNSPPVLQALGLHRLAA